MALRGCLLFPLSLLLGLILGVASALALTPILADPRTANWIGTCIWLFSALLMMLYVPLLFVNPRELQYPSPPGTPWYRRRTSKAENKLRFAEFNVGVVFAMLAGGLAKAVAAPWFIIALLVVVGGIAGAAVGHDVKRRTYRIRALLNEQPQDLPPADQRGC